MSGARQLAEHAVQNRPTQVTANLNAAGICPPLEGLRVSAHRLDASGDILAAWPVEYLAGIWVEGVVDQVVLDL